MSSGVTGKAGANAGDLLTPRRISQIGLREGGKVKCEQKATRGNEGRIHRKGAVGRVSYNTHLAKHFNHENHEPHERVLGSERRPEAVSSEAGDRRMQGRAKHRTAGRHAHSQPNS
jgi:hypothetical protein